MNVGCRAASSGNRVDLYFAAELETPFGSEVRAVGALSDLGDWRPEDGLSLQTEAGSYPWWTGTLSLLSDTLRTRQVEFKFVIVKPDGMVDWEEGPNRLVGFSNDSLPALQPPVRPQCAPPCQGTKKCGRELFWDAICDSTGIGDILLVVGAAPELGAWDAETALHLETTPRNFPRWTGSICLDVSLSLVVEWKLVIKRSDGTYEWESGDNRCTNLLRGAADEGLVTTVHFGGKCDAPVPRGEMADWGSRLSVPDESGVSRVAGAAQQSILVHADANADVEVVFEATCSRYRPAYNPSERAWCLCLTELGLAQGMHAFHLLVNGERILSDLHPVAGKPEHNLVFVDNDFWSYTHGCKKAHPRQWKRQTRTLDDSTRRHHTAPGGFSPKKLGIVRPMSTSSTASTCSCSSEKDDNQDLAPKPFSAEVFSGLYDEDLRLRLTGVVPPASVLQAQRGRPLQMWSGASRLQKPCGRCEDAYFLADRALGVADGVGSMAQFAKYGADAAAYAMELMELAGDALTGNELCDQPVDIRAEAALIFAERNVQSYGASTVTALVLDADMVGAANLGDSGFMLLRKGEQGMSIVARSEEKQHHWNCPYQLCRLPPALQRRIQGNTRFDSAADCDRYTVQVQPGDLLLVFTDGLSDNIHEHELLQIVDRALPPLFGELAGLVDLATPPAVLAESLARAAQERSLDEKAMVPFAKASKAKGMDCPGGKPDDITVVAAWIMPEVGSS
eukprot:CAMPEP_0115307448 /NCGR_PEP_ID=MMETSP0270-20121206/73146_1 /TAXON_ID=71861 /ORGANISM="Scrippsiella trochoidea, Strain CCMP3099" /LENGTH=733 /DNA_ID=CAMNT_0002725891 /DNA_START=14 /DNA_END=2215 /DNA_ORIENTATION=+